MRSAKAITKQIAACHMSPFMSSGPAVIADAIPNIEPDQGDAVAPTVTVQQGGEQRFVSGNTVLVRCSRSAFMVNEVVPACDLPPEPKESRNTGSAV